MGLAAGSAKDVIRKLDALAAEGIRSDLIVRSEDAVVLSKECAKSVWSVEGLNEPDQRKDFQPNWAEHVRAEQEALSIRRSRTIRPRPKFRCSSPAWRTRATRRESLAMCRRFSIMETCISYPGGLNPLSGGWGISLPRGD